MADYRAIGLRLPLCELVQAPFQAPPDEQAGEPLHDNEPFVEALRQRLLALCFDANNEFDETFLYVCAINARGAIVSRVEQLPRGEDGLVFDFDFVLDAAASGADGADPFTVVLMRLAREESIAGQVEAGTAREAGEIAMRYAVQDFGRDNDVVLVAVIAPDGRIEITAENWGGHDDRGAW